MLILTTANSFIDLVCLHMTALCRFTWEKPIEIADQFETEAIMDRKKLYLYVFIQVYLTGLFNDIEQTNIK